MFLVNKYYGWYFQIIEKAKARDAPIFYEEHHIIPKCMDGTDAPNNLVKLSFREHYLAHWLLVKITEGEYKRKMNYGLSKMSSSSKFHDRITSSWQYERSRKAARDAQKGVKRSESSIRRGVESRRGYKHSAITLLKMSKSPRFAGRKHSLESRLKMGRPGSKLSEDHKKRIGLANAGKRKPIGHTNKANLARKIIAEEFASKIKPIINEIYSSGIQSLYGIASELNERNIPTRYGKGIWRGGTVRQYL